MATTTTAGYLESIISRLIEECNNEVDIDKKIQLLYKINSILPYFQNCLRKIYHH
jgi:hypothetical protein